MKVPTNVEFKTPLSVARQRSAPNVSEHERPQGGAPQEETTQPLTEPRQQTSTPSDHLMLPTSGVSRLLDPLYPRQLYFERNGRAKSPGYFFKKFQELRHPQATYMQDGDAAKHVPNYQETPRRGGAMRGRSPVFDHSKTKAIDNSPQLKRIEELLARKYEAIGREDTHHVRRQRASSPSTATGRATAHEFYNVPVLPSSGTQTDPMSDSAEMEQKLNKTSHGMPNQIPMNTNDLHAGYDHMGSQTLHVDNARSKYPVDSQVPALVLNGGYFSQYGQIKSASTDLKDVGTQVSPNPPSALHPRMVLTSISTQCPSIHWGFASIQTESNGHVLKVAATQAQHLETPDTETWSKAVLDNAYYFQNGDARNLVRDKNFIINYNPQACSSLHGAPLTGDETLSLTDHCNDNIRNFLRSCAGGDTRSALERHVPPMAPPPLGYHIRRYYSSSETTVEDIEIRRSDVPEETEARKDKLKCGAMEAIHTKNRKRVRDGQQGVDQVVVHQNKAVNDKKITRDAMGYVTRSVGDRTKAGKLNTTEGRKGGFQRAATTLRRGYIKDAKDKKREKRERNFTTPVSRDFAQNKIITSATGVASCEGDGAKVKYQYEPTKLSKHEQPDRTKYVVYYCKPNGYVNAEDLKKKYNRSKAPNLKLIDANVLPPNVALQPILIRKGSEGKLKYPCFSYKKGIKKRPLYRKNNLSNSIRTAFRVSSGCDLNTNSNAYDPDARDDSYEAQLLQHQAVASDTTLETMDNEDQTADTQSDDTCVTHVYEDKSPSHAGVRDSPQLNKSEDEFSSPKRGPPPENWDEKKHNLLQACNEAIKTRMQRRDLVTNESDEFTDSEKFSNPLTGCSCSSSTLAAGQKMYSEMSLELQSSKSPALAEPLTKDDQIQSLSAKRASRTKQTEALYIKFESSLSKKVTTVVKEKNKSPSEKFRSDYKQLQLQDDNPKSLTEGEKKPTAQEVPRYTRIIRLNDEVVDKKTGRKQISETSLQTKRSMLRSPRAASKELVLACIESEHRFDAVKDLLSAACKGEDFRHSPPKCISPYKPSYEPLYEPPFEPPAAIDPEEPSEDRSVDLVGSKECSETIKSDPSEVLKTPGKKSQSAESSGSKRTKRDKSDSPTPRKSKERTQRRTKYKRVDSPTEPKKTSKKKKSTSKSKNKSEVSRDRSQTRTRKISSGTSTRKSPVRPASSTNTQERKAKKRGSKTKSAERSQSDYFPMKPEKIKGKKLVEKASEKKKKKRVKAEVILNDDEASDEDDTESVGRQCQSSLSAPVNTEVTVYTRIRTPSPRSCSPIIQNRSASPTFFRGRQDSRQGLGSNQCDEEKTRSLDRQLISQGGRFKDQKPKSHAAISADNIVNSGAVSKHLRPTESVPVFVENQVQPRPPKAAQSVNANKLKKSEKDLQKAELGWNSSLSATAQRAAAERAKMLQKRKAKYSLAKVRNAPNKGQETGTAVPRRPMQRKGQAEGDNVCSGSEKEDKSEPVLREKPSTSQVKSVQFSESIEDLEAQKHVNASDSVQLGNVSNRSEGDVLTHKNCAPGAQCMNAEFGSFERATKREASDSVNEKSDRSVDKITVEPRSHSTPPRRKRPVWLKKASKPEEGKPSDGGKEKQAAAKQIAAPMKLKLGHSAENMANGSKCNTHLYYTLKTGKASPKTSNLSLSGKATVSYNTRINAVFMTPPVNKSSKKAIASVGSPVDIKEIIEGTSVDVFDHCKMTNIRSAKSVPSIGLAAGKKLKLTSDVRSMTGKKKKNSKARESGSLRSLCSNETYEDHVRLTSKDRASPTYSVSTEVDEGAVALKPGSSSLVSYGHARRREKKHSKKRALPLNEAVDWQLLARPEEANRAEMRRVHYYGDMLDIDVFHLGLAWMVQGFFNRISYFNPCQQPSTNASGDMPANQQITD
ncbi:unnamed protein product [Lymnaea stagnalis]|uniref:Uncharacterized protein n=1 Tax=Lymnaea stagnalis TaxID=6523 RepID=A0AAV2HZ16_LYMST